VFIAVVSVDADVVDPFEEDREEERGDVDFLSDVLE
jgi:hypothetical protein